VNHLKTFGRWAFAELADVYQMESDFEAEVAKAFEQVLASAAPIQPVQA
jgi:type III restriction enzyme